MNKQLTALIILCTTCIHFNGTAQKQKPVNLSVNNRFTTVNRNVSVSKSTDGKTVVHLDAKPNEGVAWINSVNFKTGTIEFDVKGKDVLQESFVGIAFHGLNDSTYDAVYFRPFNFQSQDTIRKSHAVQYISMPRFDWSFLRDTYPGTYEKAVTQTINPNNWFHARLVVTPTAIAMYVNNDTTPSLVVKPLVASLTSKIGFWVGNGSDGDFANLSIQKN